MNRKKFFLFLLLASLVARAQAQTEPLRVWGHDFGMTADGTTVTHLTVSENDVVNYTGFSLSIVVPKGIHIAQVRSGREYVDDISLNVDRATTTHTIACNMPQDDLIKVISYSTLNQDYYPDDLDGNPVDEIFTIGLIADPTMLNGEYEVRIVDCKFAFAEGGASQPQEPVVMKMTVQGGVDGQRIDCTLGEDGVGTLCLPFAAQLPENMQAFTCVDVVGSQVVTEMQTSIPAYTPLLVTGQPGTYSFTGMSEGGVTSCTGGLLTGVMQDTEVSEGDVLQKQGTVAFYRIDPARPVTVPAYKCYLNYGGTERALGLEGVFTALKETASGSREADTLYDLNGRRVKQPGAPGVYIRGKQKIIAPRGK